MKVNNTVLYQMQRPEPARFSVGRHDRGLDSHLVQRLFKKPVKVDCEYYAYRPRGHQPRHGAMRYRRLNALSIVLEVTAQQRLSLGSGQSKLVHDVAVRGCDVEPFLIPPFSSIDRDLIALGHPGDQIYNYVPSGGQSGSA